MCRVPHERPKCSRFLHATMHAEHAEHHTASRWQPHRHVDDAPHQLCWQAFQHLAENRQLRLPLRLQLSQMAEQHPPGVQVDRGRHRLQHRAGTAATASAAHWPPRAGDPPPACLCRCADKPFDDRLRDDRVLQEGRLARSPRGCLTRCYPHEVVF